MSGRSLRSARLRGGSRAGRRKRYLYGGVLLLMVVALLNACGESSRVIDVIRASGELRIASVNSGVTLYEGARGLTGFEHDLGVAFARWLGVAAHFTVASDYRALRELVANNKAHIAAALLPVRELEHSNLRYGPSYAVSRQIIVYRRGQAQPRSTDDLIGLRGVAIDGRGARRLLENQLPVRAGHNWQVDSTASVEDVLQRLQDGEINYVVLPSLEFDALQRFYPELRGGFELGAAQPLAWLFRPSPDHSLWRAQVEFMRELRASGEFDALFARYFGHGDAFDYVAARAFMRHYKERLPAFRHAFVSTGAALDIDWRLLAAIGYQESHWSNDARSPTGVRGVMMLTRATAKLLNVDRRDPEQSIDGGARYLARMKRRLPAHITEPDRSLLALAAYNIGFAHLEDARILTQRGGRDPDRWEAVREFLPKLANRRVARKARHGYARGHQAVHFVTSVQSYFEQLSWLEAGDYDVQPPLLEPDQALISPVL